MNRPCFPFLWRAALIAAVLLSSRAYAQDPQSALQERTFADSSGLNLPYRLFVPQNYDPKEKYPLVLYLHGSGERGTDNRQPLDIEQFAQRFYSPEAQAAHPSFFLVPQCPWEVLGGDPRGEYWVNNFETYPDGTPHPGFSWTSYSTADYPVSTSLSAVTNLIPSLLNEFSIDSSRLYATGWSMGGDGTWDLLMRNPGLFAAGIPVAGMGDPTQAAQLANTPLWVFHGRDDTATDPEAARTMVSAVQAQGGNIRYTEYADGNHYTVAEDGRVYQEPGLMEWLFAQRLPNKDVQPPTPTQNLPEPGTLSLLVLGLGGAFCVKRSSQRAKRR
jgi:predicted peptidase